MQEGEEKEGGVFGVRIGTDEPYQESKDWHVGHRGNRWRARDGHVLTCDWDVHGR